MCGTIRWRSVYPAPTGAAHSAIFLHILFRHQFGFTPLNNHHTNIERRRSLFGRRQLFSSSIWLALASNDNRHT